MSSDSQHYKLDKVIFNLCLFKMASNEHALV